MNTKKIMIFIMLTIFLTTPTLTLATYENRLTHKDFHYGNNTCYNYDTKHFICLNGWILNQHQYPIVHMTQVENWYYSENPNLHQISKFWIKTWNYAAKKLKWN